MKAESMFEWLVTYGWIPILLFMMGLAGFFVWIVTKLLGFFGVI